jgi:hypothetical protein
MTAPKSCGVCKQSFESDRDLQEHQESAHQRGGTRSCQSRTTLTENETERPKISASRQPYSFKGTQDSRNSSNRRNTKNQLKLPEDP